MMTGLSESLRALGPTAGNHLWQTTTFAAAVWIATLALRKNQARVRYGLWLAASVKFLVPFALLVAVGGMLPKPQRVVAAPAVYASVDQVAEPFAEMDYAEVGTHVSKARHGAPGWKQRVEEQMPLALALVWLGGVLTVLVVWGARWRQVARVVRRAVPANGGREFDLLRRVERAMEMRAEVGLRISGESMEPGMFGIFRPVLVWPERLSERLDDAHIEAILIHELAHARRRDNLTAALHMLVEAAFWFHPLVWWMERRMVEERERACDEAVVAMGSRPGVYADGLLKAVRFCVESPLTCVSGITGADLKDRVVQIMTQRVCGSLTLGKKIMLLAAALAAVTVPIMLGQARGVQRITQDMKPLLSPVASATKLLGLAAQAPITQPIEATTPPPAATDIASLDADPASPYSFEVATIRPSHPGPGVLSSWGWQQTDNQLIVTTMSLKSLLARAYGVQPEYVLGGPDWASSQFFDLTAKFDETQAREIANLHTRQANQRVMSMLRTLLQQRFHLVLKPTTKQVPIYALIVTRGGPKFLPSSPLTPDASGILPPAYSGMTTMRDGRTILKRYTMANWAALLSSWPDVEREVIDKTGLSGTYDFTLNWKSSPDGSGPSLFSSLEDQLGLKLQPQQGPVPTVTILSAQKPTLDGAELPLPAATASVQIPSPQSRPAFDVATVKPSNPKDTVIGMFTYPGGRVVCSLCPVHYLMMEAFGIQDWQVKGGPGWINDSRYDVEAKPPQDSEASKMNNPSIKTPPNAEQRVMLQSLLIERFGMKYHRGTAEGPVYILERGDKPLKLETPKDKDAFSWAGGVQGGGASAGTGMRGANITMAQLAARLSGFLGRPVLDKTAIEGAYDFEDRSNEDDPSADVTVQAVAAMKNIGLKLTAGKGPVETIVIDHIDRPSEN
jgi:bla regulator protein BlaR1